MLTERTHDDARHAVGMLGLAQAAAFAVTGITVTIGPLSLHELSGHKGFGGGLLAVFILADGPAALPRLVQVDGDRAAEQGRPVAEPERERRGDDQPR